MGSARQRYTFAEYVDLEQLSPVKHEFLAGHVWAMAGGSPDHAAVAANIVALLHQQIPSLQEVVLVAHDAKRIVLWQRSESGWTERVTQDMGEAELRSVDAKLPLADVYRDPLE